MTLRDEINRRRLALSLTVYRLHKLAGVGYSQLCGWLLHHRAAMGERNIEKLRSALELEEAKGMGRTQTKGEQT